MTRGPFGPKSSEYKRNLTLGSRLVLRRESSETGDHKGSTRDSVLLPSSFQAPGQPHSGKLWPPHGANRELFREKIKKRGVALNEARPAKPRGAAEAGSETVSEEVTCSLPRSKLFSPLPALGVCCSQARPSQRSPGEGALPSQKPESAATGPAGRLCVVLASGLQLALIVGREVQCGHRVPANYPGTLCPSGAPAPAWFLGREVACHSPPP